MMRLYNKNTGAMPANSSYEDAARMGRLYINSMNIIRAASPTPSNASMIIYAWMTDVELGTPTATIINVTTESKDERETGPIEKIASRASDLAYRLTSVPIISPYAKASAIVLGGIGSLASLLGFSKPTVISPPHLMKNEPYQNDAQTIGSDTGKRITLDPKQELSVDPRVCGTDMDEMSIAYLCSVPSYLTSFVWADDSTPMSGALWSMPVTPMIMPRFDDFEGSQYQPTALAFAASFFEWWRGDIIVTIEFECSAYHRGKMLIWWDANISQFDIMSTGHELNKQSSTVMDLQESTTYSFCINWAFSRAWAQNLVPSQVVGPTITASSYDESGRDSCNGFIAMCPMTSLQSPNSSDISVNVYIHSDNMMFNQLLDTRLPVSRPTTESKVEYGAPEGESCISLNNTSATPRYISEEHFGEVPASFRALCKRFTSYGVITDWGVDANESISNVYATLPILPELNPSYNGVASTDFNKNLISQLRPAYVGIKGGIRHRLGLTGDHWSGNVGKCKVSLLAPADYTETYEIDWFDSPGILDSWIDGTVTFVPSTNGGVEVETPMYTNNLFGLSFSADAFPVANSNFEPYLTRGYSFAYPMSKPTLTTIYLTREVAGAEDFSLFRFQGAPAFVVLP